MRRSLRRSAPQIAGVWREEPDAVPANRQPAAEFGHCTVARDSRDVAKWTFLLDWRFILRGALRLLLCAALISSCGCGGDGSDGERAPAVADNAQSLGSYWKVKTRSPSDISAGLKELFTEYTRGFFVETLGDRDVFATELQSLIRMGQSLFIIDLRADSEFLKGHVTGAVNIPVADLFTNQSIETLPADGTPIILICEDGHLSSQAVGALGAMGYNAYALRFGMIGWNRSTPVQVHSPTQIPQTINGLGGAVAR